MPSRTTLTVFHLCKVYLNTLQENPFHALFDSRLTPRKQVLITDSLQLHIALFHLTLLLPNTALLLKDSHDWSGDTRENVRKCTCVHIYFCLFYRMHFSKLSLRTFIHLTPANWTAFFSYNILAFHNNFTIQSLVSLQLLL